MLKTFGCACFPLLRPYHTHELNFCSQECVFLGYSSSHKGYNCLSSIGRIYSSKDVLFNELRFPYLDIFPLSSSLVQNITSYLCLNPDLSPPLVTPTPSLSQLPSSHSPSASSIPLGFASVSTQPSSESTSSHTQSSNTESHNESIVSKYLFYNLKFIKYITYINSIL